MADEVWAAASAFAEMLMHGPVRVVAVARTKIGEDRSWPRTRRAAIEGMIDRISQQPMKNLVRNVAS